MIEVTIASKLLVRLFWFSDGFHHFLLIERHDDSGEQLSLVDLYHFVLETVDAVPAHSPRAPVELLVPIWVGRVFFVSDHRVSGDGHRITTNLVAFGAYSVVDVVVFTAPPEESVNSNWQ